MIGLFNIGQMKDRIDFYKNSEVEDNLQPILVPFLSGIYAKATKLLGKESVQLSATHNLIQVNFIIRYRNDIDEDMYIKHKGKFYNIVGFEALKDDSNFLLIATVLKESAEDGI